MRDVLTSATSNFEDLASGLLLHACVFVWMCACYCNRVCVCVCVCVSMCVYTCVRASTCKHVLEGCEPSYRQIALQFEQDWVFVPLACWCYLLSIGYGGPCSHGCVWLGHSCSELCFCGFVQHELQTNIKYAVPTKVCCRDSAC
jgi:hypothetical protein